MPKMRVPAGVREHSDWRNQTYYPYASDRTQTRPPRADTVGPARGMIIGLVAGIGFWAFLFAAAYLIGKYPVEVAAVCLVALIAYIVLKAARL